MWRSRQQQQSQQQHTVWRVIRISLKSTCGGSWCQCYLGRQKSDICQQRFGCRLGRKGTPDCKEPVGKQRQPGGHALAISKGPSLGTSTRTSSPRALAWVRDIYIWSGLILPARHSPD